MAISSVDMEKQRYSQELAAYTFRQWNRASQSAEEQGAPNSYKAISRKISALDNNTHVNLLNYVQQKTKNPLSRIVPAKWYNSYADKSHSCRFSIIYAYF